MSFLQDIFTRLESARGTVLLQELRDGQNASVTGRELLDLIAQARQFLAGRGLKKGD
ncbi:MAG: hypothetical protein JWO91_976, partial [Acidobacteriaceae bacterium]|nr:hypothetical protein [Acidobacteriaceae bacterium]